MGRDQAARFIEDNGIVAIVRFDRSDQLVNAARAIREGGVRAIEFTMTTPNALEILSASVKEFKGDVLLGAGTATYLRTLTWQTNLALFEDTVRKSPGFAPARNELALALERKKRGEEAKKLYLAARIWSGLLCD